MQRGLLVGRQVLLEVLGHGERLDLLGAEDGSHRGVGREPLLVLGVLEVLLLEIGPQPLDDLDNGVKRRNINRETRKILPEDERSSLPSWFR